MAHAHQRSRCSRRLGPPLFAFVLLTSCERGAAESKPERAVVLVSDQEIETLAAKYERLANDAGGQHCQRAVLFAPSTPGAGTEDLRRMLEANDACLEAFPNAVSEGLGPVDTALGSRTDQDADKAVPALGTPLAPEVDPIVRACDDIGERIRGIVSSEQVCSPYRFAARSPHGDELASAIKLSQANALVARSRAKDDPRGALAQLLDGVRFGHDVSRGGVTWMDAIIGITAADFNLRQIPLVATDPRLRVEDLMRVEAQLDLLASTLPDPHGIIATDIRAVVLSCYAPAAREAPVSLGSEWPGDSMAACTNGDPRQPLQLSRLLWVTLEREIDRLVGPCRTQPPTDCVAALGTPGELTSLDALDAMWSSLAAASSGASDEVFEALVAAQRQQLAEAMSSISMPPHAKYVRRWATSLARLEATRLAVALQAEMRKTGSCPSDLRQERWRALVEPARLGTRLELTSTDESTLIEYKGLDSAEVNLAPRVSIRVKCASS